MARASKFAGALSGTGDEAGQLTGDHGIGRPLFLKGSVPPFCHWRVRLIHEYWSLKRRDGGDLPGYQDINLGEMPDLVPYVWLIDVAHRPMRFRFHTIGSVLVTWAGEDNTGKWFDEVWPTYDPAVFVEVVERRQPSWTRGPSAFRPERRDYEIERVRLPLARDGKTVDMILALSVFFDRDGREIVPRRNDAWSGAVDTPV